MKRDVEHNVISSSLVSGYNMYAIFGVVLVILKLLGVIDWTWWCVTVPFWGPIAMIILIFGFMFFLCLLDILFSGGR